MNNPNLVMHHHYDPDKKMSITTFDGFMEGRIVRLEIKNNHERLHSVVEYFINGQVVYQRKLTAMVVCEKLFQDKLVLETGSSKGKDSVRTIFVDLATGKDIFNTQTKVFRRGDFIYDDGTLKVETPYGIFDIGQDGDYADKLNYLNTAVRSAEYIAADTLKELIDLQERTPENLAFYHKVVKEYPGRVADQFHYLSFVSAMLRLDGELYESEGNYYKAYEQYTLGLKLDNKLGVKRAMNKMSKQITKDEIETIESRTDKIAEKHKAIDRENRRQH